MNLNRLTIIVFLAVFTSCTTQTPQKVFIQYEQDNVRAEYAVRKLTEALNAGGYEIIQNGDGSNYEIQLNIDQNKLGNEAFSKFILINI